MNNIFTQMKDKLDSTKCPDCQGSGKMDDNDGFGISCNEWTCSFCAGSGINKERMHELKELYMLLRRAAGYIPQSYWENHNFPILVCDGDENVVFGAEKHKPKEGIKDE